MLATGRNPHSYLLIIPVRQGLLSISSMIIIIMSIYEFSVQFSHSVMSDSLRPHELQHARPPCPSPTPRVHSDSCPSSQWCHPAISSSLCCPLLLLPPIPPSIRVFSSESTLCMRWPKYWSFSFSIIPSKEIAGWSPSEWTGWISLQSKGLSRVFSNTTVQKHQFFGIFAVQLLHPHMTTGKTIALTRRTFVVLSSYYVLNTALSIVYG